MENMKSAKDAPPLVELRVWMATTGQRQRHVARLISVAEAKFSQYYRGRIDLSMDDIDALSRVTGIAPHRLVNDAETSRALKRMVLRAKRGQGQSHSQTRKPAQSHDVA